MARWFKWAATEIAGVQHHAPDFVADKLAVKAVLLLQREPDNSFGANAVALWARDGETPVKVGYVPRELAALLAPLLDARVTFGARVISIEREAARSVVFVQLFVSEVAQ